MIKRFDDWPERLDVLLRAAASRKFVRGRHDCALFAGEAVFVMTGVDLRARFIGRYKTKRGAAGVLRRAGGNLRDVADKISSEYGAVVVERAFAQRGDIAYVEFDGDTALAVVGLDGNYVTAGADGLLIVPPDCVKQVWRVG